MKFEQLYSFYLIKLPKFQFYFVILSNIVENLSLYYFFSWKISNYADSFWFFYSNKKTIYELRYLEN